jgi:hypothetical protein
MGGGGAYCIHVSSDYRPEAKSCKSVNESSGVIRRDEHHE